VSKTAPRLGSRVRALRSRKGLTQKAMAEQLSISASYLNLIEHNRRPLSAEVLLRLANLFEVDLRTFAAEDDSRLGDDLVEAFKTSGVRELDITPSRLLELASSNPTAARAMLDLFRAQHRTQQSLETVAERFAMPTEAAAELRRGLLPSEEVSDFLGTNGNHFSTLEAAAERLWTTAELDGDDLYAGLVDHLRVRHAVDVELVPVGREGGSIRRFDPKKRRLTLSRMLRPRTLNFQLAVQVALLAHREELASLVEAGGLKSRDSVKLATLALANYFAGAVLMPYAPFLAEAKAQRYDIELLGHRFRTSFEQVCHRLTTLRRLGAEGVPFHFVRVDIAGNIVKQFSASGIRFPRFGAGCSLWNVYRCFQQPGRVRIQVSSMPNDERFFCLATTIRRGVGGYRDEHTVQAIGMGCRAEHARQLVYSDGIDVNNPSADVKIGVTCRLCERKGCAQRAFPALSVPLRVTLDERGFSPFDA
jgi:predicted transcriptional regulator/transcriptional regulator with XRE-family HTH domain